MTSLLKPSSISDCLFSFSSLSLQSKRPKQRAVPVAVPFSPCDPKKKKGRRTLQRGTAAIRQHHTQRGMQSRTRLTVRSRRVGAMPMAILVTMTMVMAMTMVITMTILPTTKVGAARKLMRTRKLSTTMKIRIILAMLVTTTMVPPVTMVVMINEGAHRRNARFLP